MKIESTKKEERLDFFKELYERARRAEEERHEELDLNLEQYRGSVKIDGSDENAVTVRNITYEIIESQVSSEIPLPKVEAERCGSKEERNAAAIELLCSGVRDKLPFEEMNDVDERQTYIYGASVWLVEWDDSKRESGERGGISARAISPRDLFPEPCIQRIEDMDYCFLRFTTTRAEVQRKYRITDDELHLLECEFSYEAFDTECDAVSVVTCFYKDERGEIGRYVFSGEVTLSDTPEYYKRRILVCESCGRPDDECTCDKRSPVSLKIDLETVRLTEEMTEILLGREGEAEISLPYYLPKRFPIVIRKNTTLGDSLYGQSDCDYIRPEQQAINKVESRILQKLLRAGITPIIPEDATVSLNNSVFGQVIRMKPGESADMYGKVDTTPDISQDIREAERLYDHSKRVLGISDAYQGIDTSSSESGYAKQLRISQANGRLESKRRMKKAAYADIYRIIFELYLAFADEPRALYYKDVFGKTHEAVFDRRDFIVLDRNGGFCYNDSYLFSSDSGEEEYNRETLWETNLENLRSGSLGDTESPRTLLRYWQIQERAHYPYARENVEYFKALIESVGVQKN